MCTHKQVISGQILQLRPTSAFSRALYHLPKRGLHTVHVKKKIKFHSAGEKTAHKSCKHIFQCYL